MSGLLLVMLGLLVGYTMALGITSLIIAAFQYRQKPVPKVLLNISKRGY